MKILADNCGGSNQGAPLSTLHLSPPGGQLVLKLQFFQAKLGCVCVDASLSKLGLWTVESMRLKMRLEEANYFYIIVGPLVDAWEGRQPNHIFFKFYFGPPSG